MRRRLAPQIGASSKSGAQRRKSIELNTNERQQRCRDRKKSRDGHVTSRDGPDASHARARSSSSFLEERKNDDDGDVRARPLHKKPTEQITAEVAQVAKETNRWPRCGWPSSTVTAQIEKLLKLGIKPPTIIDGVQLTCLRAVGKIETFKYCLPEIYRQHQEAMAEPQLPLITTIEGGKGRKEVDHGKYRNSSPGGLARLAAGLAAQQANRSNNS